MAKTHSSDIIKNFEDRVLNESKQTISPNILEYPTLFRQLPMELTMIILQKLNYISDIANFLRHDKLYHTQRLSIMNKLGATNSNIYLEFKKYMDICNYEAYDSSLQVTYLLYLLMHNSSIQLDETPCSDHIDLLVKDGRLDAVQYILHYYNNNKCIKPYKVHNLFNNILIKSYIYDETNIFNYTMNNASISPHIQIEKLDAEMLHNIIAIDKKIDKLDNILRRFPILSYIQLPNTVLLKITSYDKFIYLVNTFNFPTHMQDRNTIETFLKKKYDVKISLFVLEKNKSRFTINDFTNDNGRLFIYIIDNCDLEVFKYVVNTYNIQKTINAMIPYQLSWKYMYTSRYKTDGIIYLVEKFGLTYSDFIGEYSIILSESAYYSNATKYILNTCHSLTISDLMTDGLSTYIFEADNDELVKVIVEHYNLTLDEYNKYIGFGVNMSYNTSTRVLKYLVDKYNITMDMVGKTIDLYNDEDLINVVIECNNLSPNYEHWPNFMETFI